MNNNKYIEVKSSGIHMRGVFANVDIAKGTIIIEYTGKKIAKEESAKILEKISENHSKDPENNAGTYIFDIDDEWDLDGDIEGNDAKYINHSCEPNSAYEITDGRIWIRSLRDIKKGEEITYNYGFDINNEDPYDFMEHQCKCGSKRCIGYILDEDEWPKVKELLANKANNKILKQG